MSLRYLAGFITASYNPLKVPNAPTITTVTAGDTQLTVAFTAPSNVGGGAITSYIAIAQTSAGVAFTATGSATPITITGLTNGTAYTVQVAAVNAFGPGPYSVGVSGTPVLPYKLFSWGVNNQGELGQNNLIYRSSPVQVGADTNWSQISSVTNSSIAIKTDGTLWSWGNNQFGQLGQNNTIFRSSPTQIGALTTWSYAVNSSGYQGFAIKTDGTLWGWGLNSSGQLGQNNTIYRSSPVQVGADTNWSYISGGANFVLAIKTNGTMWSWGSNNRGQLGQNIAYTVTTSSPVQVGALTTWSKITCGARSGYAIKTDGTMWSWGLNTSGQLGQNISYTVYRSSPVQIGALSTWANVSSSDASCLAVRTDGTFWSWGANSRGQLGQNDRVSRSSPVQIGALTTWSKISAASEISVAIKTDGTLWAWGSNGQGQLGQNDLILRSSPVQIGALATWDKCSAGNNFVIAISN